MELISNWDEHIDFPFELCSKPQSLIGVAGLDIAKNPVHRSIWESFSNGQLQLGVKFKLIIPPLTFPSIKAKRSNYERYIPKGMIKRKWMKKHLTEIPAVVAVFFELNWDDPNWDQSKLDCVTFYQSIKSALGGLSSKIAMILIQKVAPLPPAEDGRFADRANALCVACDLPNRQLFVLPEGDHLQGCIFRLETALQELSKAYYTQEIKLIKQHRDSLNKTNHRYLFVRHSFKMAFLYELKQEDRNAKSCYEVAYSHMKDIRVTDTNIQEVKLVAGFINYKLCRLMFALGEPRDAILQFKTHVKIYKTYAGPKQLAFEHFAWLAKQYSAFADLFDEAIRQGLTAMQTEHPGFYYRQAALHAIDRKLAVREFETDLTYPEPDPLSGLETLEYWGQRSWRAGQISAEPIDPILEKNGIVALQYRERSFDHSAAIITLLGHAVTQCKTFRCARLRLQLLVEMAEEYYSAKDYGKALTLLSHILWDYRNEKWWRLLYTLLSTSLRCAYLSANILDYITFALEFLNADVNPDYESRCRIFNNFAAILEMKAPEPEPDISFDNNAKSLWAANLIPLGLSIDSGNILSPFHVQATFTKSDFDANEPLSLKLSLLSLCPGPICISKVSVILSSSEMLSEFIVSSNEVILTENIEKLIYSDIRIHKFDSGKEISISNVLITIGIETKICACLKFANSTKLKLVYPEFQKQNASINSVKISMPQNTVKLSLECDTPSLLGEQIPIRVKICNKSDCALYQPVLDVKLLSPGDDSSLEQSTRLSDASKTNVSPRAIQIFLDDISEGQELSTCVYMKSYSIGDRTLNFIMSFNFTSEADSSLKKVEEKCVIPVIKPFEVTPEVLSMKFEPLINCFTHETFLLCPTIEISSPTSLIIHHSTLELGLYVQSTDKKMSSKLAGTTLSEHETGRDIFALKIVTAKDSAIALGTYVIQWSRIGSDDINSSTITMPAIRCEKTLISVDVTLPTHGKVRQQMTIEYRLYNRTNSLLQMDLSIDASDAFMFAGQKQTILRLLPESDRTFQYHLYPLFSGLVALPRMILASSEINEQLAAVLERTLPTHVYVMPQERKSSSDLST